MAVDSDKDEKRAPLLGSPRANSGEFRVVAYLSGRRRFPLLVLCLSAVVLFFLYSNFESGNEGFNQPHRQAPYYGPPDPPEALDDNLREEISRYGDTVAWDSTQHGGGDENGYAGDGTALGGDGDIEGANEHFGKVDKFVTPTLHIPQTSTSSRVRYVPTRPATPFNARPKVDLKPKPTPTPTPSDPNDVPIQDEKLSIQARRKVRPALTDPWADLPRSWKGHQLLSASRFPGTTDTAKGDAEEEDFNDGGVIWREVGMKDAPFLKSPPNEFMEAAFAYQVRQSVEAGERSAHLAPPGAAGGGGKKYDERTGRVLSVPREEIWDGVSLESPLYDGERGAEGWTPPTLDEIDVTSVKGRKAFPKVQTEARSRDGAEEIPGSREERDELRVEEARKGYVRRAFQHAWEGYKAKCYGHDEVAPVSGQCSNHYNGWGATIVDSLDTLLIMNLTHEYNHARDFVAALDFSYLAPSGGSTFSTVLPPLSTLSEPQNSGDWIVANPVSRWRSSPDDQTSPTSIPTFETIIRYLGGLIAAFDLSSDPLMLERATELGDWILPALSTRYGLPLGHYELGSNPKGGPSGQSILSEVGSLTLEFTRLTQLTGDQAYFLAAQRATDTLDKRFERTPAENPQLSSVKMGLSRISRLGTLLPTRISPDSPNIVGGEYTFGALTDSYYEYLIKQHQLISGQIPLYGRMYEDAIESARESRLIRPVEVIPGRPELVVLGTINYGRWTAEMQHLTCFAGGMLGLGAKLLDRQQDMLDAAGVTETCVWMYESSETGVGAESVEFYEPDEKSRYMTVADPLSKSDEIRKPRGSPPGMQHSNAHYIGRPETIESVFYMFRLTGDRYWQDQGWKMFTSWMEHSITPHGFASIGNNQQLPAYQTDSQESFVLAETLKYYYLLFSPPDLISLDDFVFNTEAHPFYVPRGNALSSYPSPKPLWPGFSSLPTPTVRNFVAGGREGSPVQRWARVQQAAKLSHTKSAGDYMRMRKLEKALKDQIAESVEEEEEREDVGWEPVYVRPTDEELREADSAGGLGVV